MSYSKKTMEIVQKLDAIHGAIENIKKEECSTETAKQLGSVLVKHLTAERGRLIHELEFIANAKSIRAAGKFGLPVQTTPSRRRYSGHTHQHASQIVLH